MEVPALPPYMYKIKQIPEDFIVEEISNIPLDEGRCNYFQLTKKNWNTIDVVKELGKKLGIKEKQIGFAGSKDKKAITSQMISFYNVNKGKIGRIKHEDWELQFVGSGNKPISLGDLEGNKFEIVVRNLDDTFVDKISFVENYFDEQRFSKNNVEIGKSLIKKDFNTAVSLIDDYRVKEYLKGHPTDFIGGLKTIPLRLLRMYVHAYQSYLWNETLKVYLLKKGNVTKKIKYSLSSFIFIKEHFDINIPLIGFNEELINEKLKKIIISLMAREDISFKDFIIKQIPELSLEGEMRSAFVEVQDFQVLEESDDELNQGKKKIKLSFTLPKGSYATIVVKRLF